MASHKIDVNQTCLIGSIDLKAKSLQIQSIDLLHAHLTKKIPANNSKSHAKQARYLWIDRFTQSIEIDNSIKWWIDRCVSVNNHVFRCMPNNIQDIFTSSGPLNSDREQQKSESIAGLPLETTIWNRYCCCCYEMCVCVRALARSARRWMHIRAYTWVFHVYRLTDGWNFRLKLLDVHAHCRAPRHFSYYLETLFATAVRRQAIPQTKNELHTDSYFMMLSRSNKNKRTRTTLIRKHLP